MKKGLYIGILTLITVIAIIGGTIYHTSRFVGNFTSWIFPWNWEWFDNDGTESHNVVDKNETVGAFSNVHVDVDVASVSIVRGSDYTVSYQATENMVPEYEVQGDTLEVKQKKSRAHWGKNKCDMTITVPENVDLDKVKMKSDVGDLNIENFSLLTLEVKSDVGDVTGKGLKVQGDTTLKSDTGDVIVENCIFADVHADSDVGNVRLDGCDFKNLEAESSVGDVKLDSKRNLSDSSIDAKTSVGDVSVQGKNMKHKYNTSGNDGTHVTMKGDVGNVEINW